MKNMNNKTKKWLTVAGCLVVCAVLVGLIGNQFKTEPLTDEPLPSQSSQPSDVTVTAPDAEKEKDVVVTPPDVPTTSQPETLPPQTDLPEQKIQPDVVKPQTPESPKTEDGTDRTPPVDKDHTFTPESPDAPPTYKPEETEKKPTPPPSKPSGGNSIPGFDNVPDGGPNQGEYVDGDGDINKQVGIMD